MSEISSEAESDIPEDSSVKAAEWGTNVQQVKGSVIPQADATNTSTKRKTKSNNGRTDKKRNNECKASRKRKKKQKQQVCFYAMHHGYDNYHAVMADNFTHQG